MSIEKVNSQNFEQVLSENKFVVLEAFATWCGYCKMFAPTLESVASEFQGKVKFCKIDADENQDYIESLGVDLYPTLLYFKDGKQVKKVPNVSTKDAIRSEVETLFNS